MKITPETPKVAEIPIQPEIIFPVSPLLEKDPEKPELLKTIKQLKKELAEKDKQLQNKDSRISLLINENQKLKAINQQKDQQLAEYKESNLLFLGDFDKSLEKSKKIAEENNSLLQNYIHLKNTAKNISGGQGKDNQKIEKPSQLEISPKNNNFLLTKSPNTLSEIKEPKNNSPAKKEKPQSELQAQIQV